MAIYRISYSRIEYKNRKFHRKVFLGAILVGELNYCKNINRLERFGKGRGIDTLVQGDEMLSIETEEFSVKRIFDWNNLKETFRTSWELISAESL